VAKIAAKPIEVRRGHAPDRLRGHTRRPHCPDRDPRSAHANRCSRMAELPQRQSGTRGLGAAGLGTAWKILA